VKIKFTHKKDGKTRSGLITEEKYFSFLVRLHSDLGIPMERLMSDKARMTGGEAVQYVNQAQTILFEKLAR